MDSSVLQRVKEKASSFQQKSKDWKHCGKWLRSVGRRGKNSLTANSQSQFGSCYLHAYRCGVIDYVDPAGNAREYETMERTTRTKLTGVDGVDVISEVIP